VCAATCWTLLGQDSGPTKTAPPAEDEILENAFYPFTLPITVGPGSISVAITLGAHLPPELHETSLFSLRVLVAAIAGITLICLIIYLCYVYARKAEQLLGRSGTSMVMRLSSFILLCIGVQIISTGIKAYLQTIGKF
jgi:multiple antibiotic resistance protein